jgi:hypothetical protein
MQHRGDAGMGRYGEPIIWPQFCFTQPLAEHRRCARPLGGQEAGSAAPALAKQQNARRSHAKVFVLSESMADMAMVIAGTRTWSATPSC